MSVPFTIDRREPHRFYCKACDVEWSVKRSDGEPVVNECWWCYQPGEPIDNR